MFESFESASREADNPQEKEGRIEISQEAFLQGLMDQGIDARIIDSIRERFLKEKARRALEKEGAEKKAEAISKDPNQKVLEKRLAEGREVAEASDEVRREIEAQSRGASEDARILTREEVKRMLKRAEEEVLREEEREKAKGAPKLSFDEFKAAEAKALADAFDGLMAEGEDRGREERANQ